MGLSDLEISGLFDVLQTIFGSKKVSEPFDMLLLMHPCIEPASTLYLHQNTLEAVVLHVSFAWFWVLLDAFLGCFAMQKEQISLWRDKIAAIKSAFLCRKRCLHPSFLGFAHKDSGKTRQKAWYAKADQCHKLGSPPCHFIIMKWHGGTLSLCHCKAGKFLPWRLSSFVTFYKLVGILASGVALLRAHSPIWSFCILQRGLGHFKRPQMAFLWKSPAKSA